MGATSSVAQQRRRRHSAAEAYDIARAAPEASQRRFSDADASEVDSDAATLARLAMGLPPRGSGNGHAAGGAGAGAARTPPPRSRVPPPSAPVTSTASPAGSLSASTTPTTTSPSPSPSPVTVVCPRCRSVGVAPAPMFQCPCGQLLVLPLDPHHPQAQPQAAPQHILGYNVVQIGGSMFVVPAAAVQAEVRALPVNAGGTEPETTRSGGVSKQMLEMLPVAKWKPTGSATSRGKTDGCHYTTTPEGVDTAGERGGCDGAHVSTRSLHPDRVTCRICLVDYDDGDDVKTLPCMHRFHADCVDTWLGSHKTCPVCKIHADGTSGLDPKHMGAACSHCVPCTAS